MPIELKVCVVLGTVALCLIAGIAAQAIFGRAAGLPTIAVSLLIMARVQPLKRLNRLWLSTEKG